MVNSTEASLGHVDGTRRLLGQDQPLHHCAPLSCIHLGGTTVWSFSFEQRAAAAHLKREKNSV